MGESCVRDDAEGSLLGVVGGLGVAVAVYMRGEDGPVTLAVSDGFVRLLGFASRAEAIHVMDTDMYRDTHPEDRARIEEAAALFSRYDDTYDVTYRTRPALGGDWFLMRARGVHVRDAELGLVSIVVYTTESDATRELATRLDVESSCRETSGVDRYDQLTGLPSVEGFMSRLQSRMSGHMASEVAVVYLNVAGMKSVNSTDGTDVGDEMLRHTGEAMAAVFGAELCTRAAGDRFMAMAPVGLAAPLVGRVVDLASRSHGERTTHVHVGIYDVRDGDSSAMVACDRAKWAAMVDAGVHASTVARFDAAMARAMETDRYVRANIDSVLAENRISVWYQPIVRAGTREVAHYEALARWVKDTGDILPPVDFVPTLESSRACVALDRFVMRTVASDIDRRRRAGCARTRFSVNVSRADLAETDVASEVASALDAYGISHDTVAVEITESATESDPDLLSRQMDGLHEMGFSVWMDDFGEGLSSLGALQRLDFDLVKLDMGLVRDVVSSERARTVVRYAIEMAKGIDVPVVAEGVESVEQERFLVGAGCDYLQGYLYGRPSPLEDIACADVGRSRHPHLRLVQE